MTDYYEHIEDYIKDRLSAEDKTAFVKAMSDDADLAAAVGNYDVLSDALDLLIEDDIRGVMADMDMGDPKDEKESISNRESLPKGIRSFLIFMAAMIILGVAAYFVNSLKESKNERLYASYFKPYIQSGTRGDEIKVNELKSCDRGHYYMTQGDMTSIEDILKTSIENKEDCRDKASWYLALYHIKKGDYNQANMILEAIVSEQTIYSKSAEELLKNL